MRSYFADELLLMLPLADEPGVRLWGEVLSPHRGPLALALADEAADTDDTDEIVLDLTEARFVSNSVLEILTVLARRLTPPQSLLVRAGPELGLRERISEHGWDHIQGLHLVEV
ncbi:hypothetical protein [Streptomyces silvensis]|uniref:STAS domain-containing protein n=1 Tax=Streptomyces silvensis TaxID=1765722 RepID=A0A0W7X5A5_9ACTN|nr:hypothetical protein [Streptomyces silvensis]KUF18060.1 hypothetical protein AT728_20775 [Streptomyces silvensis]